MSIILSEPDNYRALIAPSIAGQIAIERRLADVDSFVDGLDTSGRSSVDSDWATRVPGRLEASDDAVVVHALMVASQRGDAETCLEAAKLLADRFLTRGERWINDQAAEIAGKLS